MSFTCTLGLKGSAWQEVALDVGDASKHVALSQPRFNLSVPTEEIIAIAYFEPFTRDEMPKEILLYQVPKMINARSASGKR